MARQGQLITASFPKQSCGSSAPVARGAKGSPPRAGHKMGTQNQAIGKSKGGMATKRLVVLPRGERPTPTTSTTSPPLFQFALPRGERLTDAFPPGWLVGFNSRSRVGSDLRISSSTRNQGVSIRAPAWGATQPAMRKVLRIDVSIRAPAWGATPSCIACLLISSFQFALPRGERLRRRRPALAGLRFQLALPREERLSRAVVS